MYVRPISERLLSGRLTPAIRATTESPLTLLVTLVLADHQHHPVAADDLALLAHRLDRRSYLHDPFQAAVFRRLGSGCRCGRRYRVVDLPWRRRNPWRSGRTPDGSKFARAEASRTAAMSSIRRAPPWCAAQAA